MYVPFHSARIELCQEAIVESAKNSNLSSTQTNRSPRNSPVSSRKSESKSEVLNNNSSPLVSMVQNTWHSVLEGWKRRGYFGEIVRYDVVFESHRGMDGIIGRSAHIRLLDNPKVMQMLITTNANLFQ